MYAENTRFCKYFACFLEKAWRYRRYGTLCISKSDHVQVVEHLCANTNLMLGENLVGISKDMDLMSYRTPLGVCAGIAPFNFPAMIPLWMFPTGQARVQLFVPTNLKNVKIYCTSWSILLQHCYKVVIVLSLCYSTVLERFNWFPDFRPQKIG